jgi:hypothetical protein
MKNYTQNEILAIVLSAAEDYSEKLLDRHFLIIYQDRASKNAYKYKEIGFRDYNFLHLTGLKTEMSASAFFSAATSDRLSVKQFHTRKISSPTNRVVAIYTKAFDDEFYESTTYIHTAFDANSLLKTYPNLPIKNR